MAVATPTTTAAGTFFGPRSNVLLGRDIADSEKDGKTTVAVAPLPGDRELRKLIDQLLGPSGTQPAAGSKDETNSKRVHGNVVEERERVHAEALARERLLTRTREVLANGKRRNEILQEVANEVKNKVLHRRYPYTLAELFAERECTRCRKTFSLVKSIGRWQCWMHPELPDYKNRRWPCCGRDHGLISSALGCTRCDHTDSTGPNNTRPAWQVLDPELIELIEPPLACIIEGPPYDEQQTRYPGGLLMPLVSELDRPKQKQKPLIYEGMADHEVMALDRAKPRPQGIYHPSRFWMPLPGEEALAPPLLPRTTPKGEQKPQWFLLTAEPL